MPVLGVSLTKMNAEKKLSAEGTVDVSNNVEVTDVAELTKGAEKGLKFSFRFKSSYDPEAGSITIEGELFYADAKKNKEILDLWKKEKKIDQALLTDLLNIVLRKCSIEALILSRELGLPSPIPMPVFRREK